MEKTVNQPEQKTQFELAQSKGITFKCIKCGKVIENLQEYPCKCSTK